MKPLRLVWDFIFGVLVIGAAPVIALALVAFITDRLMGAPDIPETFGRKIIFALSMAAVVVAPLAAVWFAARWRMRHRVLPGWMMWVEVPLGMISGGAFYLIVSAIWLTNDPNF